MKTIFQLHYNGVVLSLHNKLGIHISNQLCRVVERNMVLRSAKRKVKWLLCKTITLRSVLLHQITLYNKRNHTYCVMSMLHIASDSGSAEFYCFKRKIKHIHKCRM